MASNDRQEGEEECWRHPFHHKLLTLEFVGFLITDENWRNKILKMDEKRDILTGAQDEGKFKEFVEAFKELEGFKEFVDSREDHKKDKSIYEDKCRREIETEYSRYRQLWDKKNTERGKKYLTDDLDVSGWVQDPSLTAEEKPYKPKSEIPPDALEKEVGKRVERAPKEFKIVFGRRDHHLVASLVEALWSMRGEGEIRIAYVPREQLLSVDMEDREIREVTLQLHPNKPVYKRRDKDEIRGFEEEFIGLTPWCRVPGGRSLSRVTNDDMYKLISGRGEVEKIWIEDEWLMSERKRIYRTERKRNKDKSPVKVTDPYDQVNHYLPLLKEVSGFRGLIRDDDFYEGLQGLIYIVRVVAVAEPPDLLTHVERLTSRELEFRKDLRDMKRERETEVKS